MFGRGMFRRGMFESFLVGAQNPWLRLKNGYSDKYAREGIEALNAEYRIFAFFCGGSL